ncbi:MAG: ABC transporter permease [Anaerolineae bacterium]|nr:ABC transporter permease [Anaerolineae bacterium]
MRAVQRAITGIITVLLAASVSFFLLRVMPGNAVRTILLESGAGESAIAGREAALGLNQPVLHQYAIYMAGLFRGDSGVSLLTGLPVSEIIAQQAFATIQLAFAAMLIGLPAGLILGLLGGLPDHRNFLPFRVIIALLLAMPTYWLGIVALYTLTYIVPLREQLVFMPILLPALVLGLSVAGSIGRVTQGQVAMVAAEPFIMHARARGLPERLIARRHILRPGLVPVAASAVLQIGFLAGGVVMTEILFSRPGLGRTLMDAVLRQDYPVVQGIVVWVAVILVIANFLIEMLYPWIDPRVRLAE